MIHREGNASPANIITGDRDVVEKVHASQDLAQWVGCHECDLLMLKPDLAMGESAFCPRCGHALHTRRRHVVKRSLALVIAALLLYVPDNFYPSMELNLLGQSSHETLWSGVLAIYQTGMQGVAAVTFLASMGIPLLKLLCQLLVLLSIQWKIGRSYGLLIFRKTSFVALDEPPSLMALVSELSFMDFP